MTLQEKITQIEELKEKIEAYGLFDQEIKKQIDYKFRLDWNYYSNRMEGGTLTRSETRSVMVGNVEVHGKPIKDIMEMKNHDEAVLDILKLVKGEQQISEKRIQELHKAIMYEESPGKRTLIGKWKTESNEIINYRNEKFLFTAPKDVPEELHKLLDRTKADLDKYFRGISPKHPIEIACEFHIDFLTIHPFYDGNGRLCRILTNLILISCGYPPFIIKEKEKYYRYLADIQCYGGDRQLLLAFLADQLLNSQELVLKAIKGESIEEEDDLDKRLTLLDQQVAGLSEDNEIKMQFNHNVFLEIYDTWFTQLFKELLPTIQKFNKYFINTEHKLSVGDDITTNSNIVDETPEEILLAIREKVCAQLTPNTHINNIFFRTFYGTFKKGGLESFGCNYRFEVQFSPYKYEIFVDEFQKENAQAKFEKKYEHLYSKPLIDTQIKSIVKTLGTSILDHIEYHIAKASKND